MADTSPLSLHIQPRELPLELPRMHFLGPCTRCILFTLHSDMRGYGTPGFHTSPNAILKSAWRCTFSALPTPPPFHPPSICQIRLTFLKGSSIHI